MKKAVMISIRQQWAEKIARGEKTLEIRRTAPLLRPPFKAYIYMCGKGSIYFGDTEMVLHSGKVIGEFVCDKIECVKGLPDIPWSDPNGERELRVCKDSCLTFDQMAWYGEGSNLWAWHISELKIYDQAKSMKEFVKPCDSAFLAFGECPRCDMYSSHFKRCTNYINIPQSWCYVEVDE